MSNFLYFNKSDRKVLLLLLLMATIAILVLFFGGRNGEMTVLSHEDSMEIAQEDSFQRGTYQLRGHKYHQKGYYRNNYYGSYYQGTQQQAQPVAFDPNTADSTTLLRIGLSPWQVRNIYRYRGKGGRFHKPEDFAKIYGVTKEQYNHLKPFIRISADYLPAADFVKNENHRDTVRYPVKLLPNEFIVLNKADTTQLKKVPGIGSGWARRIMSYGERLGGYVDVMQLTEMDGFPPEALEFFIIEDPQPRKINVNQLTINQLRRHPYINFYQARAINDYRRLKGDLHSLDQLKLLKDFPPEAIERLAPYVVF